ncbi:hypothetical protein PF005_g796 [Phytophthora fragariae]|uniref:RxLR effector protein n=1 Tax=Phytophthora fragariae TaxID=53985 RepID=A0A6A3FYH1_9STRA|nr:hypothetical protein PF009_g1061 [Phytophthora fragariae]KAE9030555.1 hypothetical protein PF011_g565 [Phytophthora fragariae]KAE9138734.1 hypothetical protein PF010_g845 [Phytophthora fragariae]KAE9139942.1 hypothetical protein PF007_g839 [Phytophthora fragariae]KAE9155392.1 hypothetical protein PF006_g641 [Phytophthora fragariae]
MPSAKLSFTIFFIAFSFKCASFRCHFITTFSSSVSTDRATIIEACSIGLAFIQ